MRRTRHTRSDTARRSPDPMKRRARKKSLATASAGRAGSAPRTRSEDRRQQFDRGGDPSSRGHASASGSVERSASSVTRAAQTVFIRLPGTIDPEDRETEGRSTERIPWIRRDKADRIRRQSKPVGSEPVDTRIRFEHAHRLDAQHVVEQSGDPGRSHRIGQHARLAVGQDGTCHAPRRATRPAWPGPPDRRSARDTRQARRRAARDRRCRDVARHAPAPPGSIARSRGDVPDRPGCAPRCIRSAWRASRR